MVGERKGVGSTHLWGWVYIVMHRNPFKLQPLSHVKMEKNMEGHYLAVTPATLMTLTTEQ